MNPGTPSHPINRRIVAGFAAALAILVAIGVDSYRSALGVAENSRMVAHTHEVLSILSALYADILAVESARRGYILAGDEAQAERARTTANSVRSRVPELRRLTADNPRQQSLLDRLEPLIARRLAQIEESIERRQRNPNDREAQSAATIAGTRATDHLRGTLGEMFAEERALLGWRDADVNASLRRAKWVITLGSVSAGLLVGVASLFFHRESVQRQQAQDAVLRLNAELEQKVAEALAANQELQAFSYSVSHDLRAPIRHINGFVHMLRRRSADALDAIAQRHLETIGRASRHMGQLIDDLLAFSRMGQGELVRTRVALGPLTREIIESLRPETEGRAVEWKVDHLPEVTGDRALLRIVFNNLLGNAVKYTRPRPHAVIEIGGGAGSTGEIVVFVKDNGVGFDMQYADKLFGVFQRLHRSEEFEGTGIGLATVRRIIRRHGGRTWADAAVDGGAIFYIALPAPKEGARGGAERPPAGLASADSLRAREG